MQVKRLQIKALCGIETLDLAFRPGANVLIGVNGVGKSSVLQCLAFLVLLHTDLAKTGVPKPNSEVLKSGHTYSINSITFQANDEEGSWSYTVPDLLLYDETTEPSILEPNPFTLDERWSKLEFLSKINKKVEEGRKLNPDMSLPLGIYYPASRFIPSNSLQENGITSNNGETDNSLNMQALGGSVDFTEFFTWFKDREDLENETRLETNPNYRDRQLEAIRNAIPIFLPGFSHLRIKRSPRRMVVTKNGQELIISQLSDGEKSLLTIIGDIARRLAICNPALENPLEGEGIILIDEIDAHLHPKWQRDLVPKLVETFPNCQFFITTHSPQIISDVRSENIYLLKQDEAGEVIAVHPDGTYGRDSNQILEDVMGVSARPELVDRHLKQLFRLIDSGDLSAARDLKNQLESAIGIDEPEFAKADVLIRRKEILGR
jgi:predicted ATP-binding protein involved in virulence